MSTAALRHNLGVLRERAGNCRVMAVIKANAYGHGLIGAARALDEADSLAVARVNEALTLRDAGIDKPIVLLEGVIDTEELEYAARSNCEIVVHHMSQVEQLRNARLAGVMTVWLKLDSGMNRLGLSPAQFNEALRVLDELPGVLKPVKILTHLANAELREHESNARQRALLERVTRGLTGERSICNSAALLSTPDSCANWVRPGLALYGVSPFGDSIAADFSLIPVMALRARIIALKDIESGEHVGYGSTWTARSRTGLAVASIGYGDGYPRSIGDGTPVVIHGMRSHIVGRVSMDMISIDVTGRDDVRIGDDVTLWGDELPVEEIAACARTIPYELLSGLTQRVDLRWE